MTHAIRFFCPAPVSLKNNYVTLCPHTPAGRRSGLRRHFNRPNDKAQAGKRNVAQAAGELLDPFERPAFPTQDVRVTVVVNTRSNTMGVEVEPIRERPKGYTGRKRDLHGHLESMFDALEGIIYANDNQVAEIHVYRNTGETQHDAEA